IAGGLGAIPYFFEQEWFDQRISKERIVDPYMEMKVGKGQSGEDGELLLASTGSLPREDEDHGSSSSGVVKEHIDAEHSAHYPTLFLSLGMLFFGAAGSWVVFAGPWRKRDIPREVPLIGRCKKVLVNLYYFDKFYYKVFVGGLLSIRTLVYLFDKWIIDGIVNLSGLILRGVSALSGWFDNVFVDGTVREISDGILDWGKNARKIQTGKLQEYVALSIILFGGMIVFFIIINKL
ncbi:MAG: hypothetical protein O6952_02905, partial [Planctomycetota bacterium]|nr:hypothetical protein [Planctomycetota bacterium]